MSKNYFDEVLQLQFKLLTGVLYNEVRKLRTCQIALSDIPGEYINFAIPTVESPHDLNRDEIEQVLTAKKEKPSICLVQKHLENGFAEYLVREGYSFEDMESWMGYDKNTYKAQDVKSKITSVSSSNFSDFQEVLGKVFEDFPGNETYLQACLETMQGKRKSSVDDLKLELYLIYDNGKPAAGAGLFYSKSENYAYLHDAGTLEQYRGKGYQTDLIRHRINVAIENDIDRIYSCVEFGSKSWSNSIKCGLNTMQTNILMVKK